jgi:predicted phosphodiesterase
LRIFAVSDIHIDYGENKKWLFNISKSDYTDDILILAGDITSRMPVIIKAFTFLKNSFKEVMYIPGNHDVWINKAASSRNSLDNFNLIRIIADNCGIQMRPVSFEKLSIIPLFGWYDYSFGAPSENIYDIWLDFTACEWPEGFDEISITKYFISLNEEFLNIKNEFIISFSHFLPRIDIMPSFVPQDKRIIYPVLGTNLIEDQIRKLSSDIHVYGHSHINNRIELDGTVYINNAFGYPSERMITSKKLLKIYDID